ncbi:hypothetical protein ACOBQJ_03940 [Pelotomaculum propionicicum]|uniref:hypothetical protein n=1 Tax=Pelotomaculum propionicicum TaxID=258475 RepID=UPI003B7EC765
MSNQFLLWSLVIVPWLTLIFMNKEDIKRFMPAALFTSLTSMVVVDVGITLNFWVVQETAYPLRGLPYHLGLSPVLIIWMLYATYGRFWWYLVLNVIQNFGFTYLLIRYLSYRGIEQLTGISPLQTTIVASIHGILIYGYQMWQEDALVPAIKTLYSTKPQPAATKPLFKNEDDEDYNK